jgi:Leucine-rich repeat (LRR) protein
MKPFVLLGFALCWTAVADTPKAPVDHKDDAQWIEDLGGAVQRGPQGKVISVDLRGTWVTDNDLRRLTNYSDLEKLDLSLTHITDGGLQEIKNLKGITDFNLYFAEYVTDEGVASIKDWKQLKRLNLHGTKASDTALEHIAGINTLESLDVGSTLMTDVGLERLTSLTNLRELTMGGNELGDAGLQALRQMPALTYLDLSGRNGNDKNVWSVSISNTGLQAILTLKNLRELRFSCTSTSVGIEGKKLGEISTLSITGKWLEQMKALPNLERLKLQGCARLDNQSVATLIAMPALKEADLKGTSVTEEGARLLKAAKPGATVYVGPWEGKAGAFRNN